MFCAASFPKASSLISLERILCGNKYAFVLQTLILQVLLILFVIFVIITKVKFNSTLKSPLHFGTTKGVKDTNEKTKLPFPGVSQSAYKLPNRSFQYNAQSVLIKFIPESMEGEQNTLSSLKGIRKGFLKRGWVMYVLQK